MDELLGREEALSDRLLGGDEGYWLVGLLRVGCVILQEGRVMYVCLWRWLWDRETREKEERKKGIKEEKRREERKGVQEREEGKTKKEGRRGRSKRGRERYDREYTC